MSEPFKVCWKSSLVDTDTAIELYAEENKQLREQLAAAKAYADAANVQLAANREQLAAERKKYERLWETSGMLSEEIAQLNLQLDAAVEALERTGSHDRYVRELLARIKEGK